MNVFSGFLSAVYPIGLPIALSLTAYNAFLTGLIVLVKRKDLAGFYYFISSSTIFLWGVGISFMLHNALPDSIACAWGTFSQVVALFIPVTWLHFVLVYTAQKIKFKKILWTVYLVTALLFPFSLTEQFVAGFRPMVEVNRYPIPGIVYMIFTAFFAATVLFSFYVFFCAIKNRQSAEKRRDFYLVCFSSLYGFGTGSLAFLPVYGVHLPQYNLLAMPLWQILLAIAMTRYRVFDLVQLAEAAQRDKLAAIGTLSASMNHEIKNPLFIIRGLTETYLSKFEESSYKESSEVVEKTNDVLKRIHEQATRAMDIMRRFSSFSKQSINADVKNTSSYLDEILSGVMPLVRHELELKNIEVVLTVPANLPKIILNVRDGEEIFFNLIVNAVQAIKNQCLTNISDETALGRIEIKAVRENNKVIVWVKDNGPGLPNSMLGQIFDPFYTTKTEGTGLGLYITRQLIERNEGRIDVKSEMGKGTAFRLRFCVIAEVSFDSIESAENKIGKTVTA